METLQRSSNNDRCAKKADSIAVQINGNDHYLTDVIVFDYAHIGVEVNGAANVLQAVHTWNGGGIGMKVAAHQTRLLGCYLDYNFLQVVDPSGLTVSSQAIRLGSIKRWNILDTL